MADIRCGTSSNFGLLGQAAGPKDRVVGVDFTDAMPLHACERVQRHRCNNVELVQGDTTEYQVPQRVNGVLSTLALPLVPESELVVRRGCEVLTVGGHWAVLDLKWPRAWPLWLRPLLMPLIHPFAVNEEWLERRL